MATHDVTIFNAHADEPSGTDVVAFLGSAHARGFASAATASGQISNSESVSLSGAESSADAGSPIGQLPLPVPGQDTYFSGLDRIADIEWRDSPDIVTGWDMSFPDTHVGKFAGVFQNPNSEGVASYWRGPRLRRVNIDLKDIQPTKSTINWSPLRNALNQIAADGFLAAHLNVRGNAVSVWNNDGNPVGADSVPPWLLNEPSSQGPGTVADTVIDEGWDGAANASRRVINVDLREDAVQSNWLRVIQSFEDEGFPADPRLHNILLHGVSSSLGEEWTGKQADNTPGVEAAYLPVITAWADAFLASGTQRKVMWLKHTPDSFVAATLDRGTGIRGGGAIEKWLAPKYTPGDADENGLVAEEYETGDYGSYYLTVDNNFIVTADDRAWQDQPEVVDKSLPENRFHYRYSLLRCGQLGFDNIFIQNNSDWDPRFDHWISFQLGQNVDDPSAEAFCALGEFWSRGGGQLTTRTRLLRNVEKWLYQRESYGATTGTSKRAYNKNIWGGTLGPGAEAAGWFSRRGSSIGFSLDPSFTLGSLGTIIKITYIDQGSVEFTLNYDAGGGIGSGSRSLITSNSADVRTVTYFLSDFVAGSTYPNKTFTIDSNGNVDFLFVRVIKWQ